MALTTDHRQDKLNINSDSSDVSGSEGDEQPNAREVPQPGSRLGDSGSAENFGERTIDSEIPKSKSYPDKTKAQASQTDNSLFVRGESRTQSRMRPQSAHISRNRSSARSHSRPGSAKLTPRTHPKSAKFTPRSRPVSTQFTPRSRPGSAKFTPRYSGKSSHSRAALLSRAASRTSSRMNTQKKSQNRSASRPPSSFTTNSSLSSTSGNVLSPRARGRTARTSQRMHTPLKISSPWETPLS
eukprot:876955_1